MDPSTGSVVPKEEARTASEEKQSLNVKSSDEGDIDRKLQQWAGEHH